MTITFAILSLVFFFLPFLVWQILNLVPTLIQNLDISKFRFLATTFAILMTYAAAFMTLAFAFI